jgi:hypothetical protein
MSVHVHVVLMMIFQSNSDLVQTGMTTLDPSRGVESRILGGMLLFSVVLISTACLMLRSDPERLMNPCP